jgi:GPH family glycoside/pentoside/hexuronide:cation symporter
VSGAATPAADAAAGRLGTAALLLYSGPAVIISILTFALVVYVPAFYTTEVKLSLTSAGLLFLLARAWDAVTDPLIGLWSDRTRSRFGRRKPWIVVATPVLVISTWLLFQPPAGAGAWYLLIAVFVYYLAWTAVQIPYLSWGAELSSDYAERNRIVGWREGMMFVGVVLATALPIAVFAGHEPSLREILGLFALLTAIVLPLGVVLAAWRVPVGSAATEAQPGFAAALAAVRRNRAFGRLLVASFLLWLGLHVYNAAVLMIVQFSLDLPASYFLRLVLVQFVVGTLVTPLIVRAANRYGKHRALAAAAVGTALTLPLMLLLPAGSFPAVAAVFALLGVTISPIWVLPTALVADAVDVGRLQGGGEQSGLYMATYNLVVKAALALSVGVALPLMAALGFDPADPVGARAVWGLNFTGLVLPGIIWVGAVALLWRYPIDRARHAEIRRELEARASRS